MSKYKAIVGEDDVLTEAKKLGLEEGFYFKGGRWNDDYGFYTRGITVDGTEIPRGLPLFSMVSRAHGEIIKGLHCPDCDAQAYRTDHPNVAACGATTGWFFFYQEVEKKKKTVLKVVNGEMKEVEIEDENLKGGE